MSDPATADEYNEKYMRNSQISGHGVSVVTTFPCPGCAEPGWLDFPITAALNDYADIQHPATCGSCGRSFRMAVTVDESGGSRSVGLTVIQTGGPDVPAYLPPIQREGGHG